MYNILNKLEELYANNLVYRTIIVCNNTEDYKYILNINNYDVYILDKYNDKINYDALDIRILLIKKEDFIQFIEDYNKKELERYFYTSIIFDPEEEGDIELKNQYLKQSKNNTLLI
jgi:hypothetical protein